MEFYVIDFSRKDEWKQIVKNKEIYYQWEYVDAFYKNGDGEPFLVYAKNKDNYVFNVYLKRDIANVEKLKGEIETNKYFDISTPYGYGGVDIVGEKNDELLKYFYSEFYKYCNKNNIISEFVRLNPLSNNYKLYKDTDYEIVNISKTIYINLENQEQIWEDMESKCRNKIRKAQKNGLVIKSGFTKEMFKEFFELYNETMKRDNATEYYYFSKDFFESIYINMKNNAKLYIVYYQEKAINALLVIYNETNANYHLSGSLSNFMNLGANNLSLYEVAKDLCNKGYKKFHLGGGYGGDDSPLLKFKKGFNKKGELNFYIAKKIFDKEVYDYLVKKRLNDEKFDYKSKFFPLYRDV